MSKATLVGKSYFIEKISNDMDVTKADAERFINSFLDAQEEALLNEEIEGIQFMGLYSIKKKHKKERMCKNPRTQEPVLSPASIGLKITMGKQLDEALNED